jgi:hypothetical protein
MGIDNNIQIDVTLSGTHDTSVRQGAGDSNVTVALGQQDISVNQLAGSSVTIGQEGQTVNIGMAGVQGAASSSIYAQGLDGNIQYNRLGFVSGAETFLFFPQTDEVLLSGGVFTLRDSAFRITGTILETNDFLIRDINDSSNHLLHIDQHNKKVTLTKNATENEYYFGVGLDDPEERLHVGGNLRVEGDIYVTGHIVPTVGGVSDLGSTAKPFRELYLQGQSVNFVDAQAKISATKQGFNFFVEETIEGQTQVREVMSVLTGIGGSKIAGIAEFVEGFKMDATQLTGMPYTGLKHNGVFIEQTIPENSESLTINYGETLPYTPRVICSVVPPEGSSDLYFTHVSNIGNSSCEAVFSSKIAHSNYKVNCFISPRDL